MSLQGVLADFPVADVFQLISQIGAELSSHGSDSTPVKTALTELCAALDLPIPDEPFPHTNTREEFRERLGLDDPT